jgi:hypothetical protein
VLRSARVTGVSGLGVLHGTVAARPLLQMLGSDETLHREGLEAPTAMTSAAQFAFVPNGIKVTVDVATTIRALGQSPKDGSWTWEINVVPLPKAVPAIPSTRVIRVGRNEPGWASALQHCTAQHR